MRGAYPGSIEGWSIGIELGASPSLIIEGHFGPRKCYQIDRG